MGVVVIGSQWLEGQIGRYNFPPKPESPPSRMADTLSDEWQHFGILMYVADSCVKVKGEKSTTKGTNEYL